MKRVLGRIEFAPFFSVAGFELLNFPERDKAVKAKT